MSIYELIEIPAARFLMGDDDGRPDERPAHVVTISAFAVARVPVTNAQYRCFLDATAYELPRFSSDPLLAADEQPVVGLRWGDAAAFCAWLSGCIGRLCRLPTEAEWELAARGGPNELRYSWGEESPLVNGVSLADAPQTAPYPVGFSPPNVYGLQDMGFNIHEWCADWYDADYYARSPRNDPRGPSAGERRASRGGAWRHRIKISRCSARSSLPPEFRYNDYGFRVFADAR